VPELLEFSELDQS